MSVLFGNAKYLRHLVTPNAQVLQVTGRTRDVSAAVQHLAVRLYYSSSWSNIRGGQIYIAFGPKHNPCKESDEYSGDALTMRGDTMKHW